MPSDLNETTKKILVLNSRKRIYELVEKFAGSHFREIERKSKMPYGSVKYHLNYLAKHKLISVVRDGNRTRYYPKQFKLENVKLLGLLRQKSIRNILLILLNQKMCSHKEITYYVKLSPSTISWHLNKLEKEGIISSKEEGRMTYYKLITKEDEIIPLLIRYKESFLDSIVDNFIEMWN